jgi:hypothetical protein
VRGSGLAVFVQYVQKLMCVFDVLDRENGSTIHWVWCGGTGTGPCTHKLSFCSSRSSAHVEINIEYAHMSRSSILMNLCLPMLSIKLNC